MSEAVRRIGRENPVEQARRLEAEAKSLARGAAETLLADLAAIAERCSDIGTLSSLPNGLRDLLPRLGDQISQALEQARAIEARAS